MDCLHNKMSEDHHYHPHDTVKDAAQALAMSTGVGLLFASVQSTLTKQNIGALGTFTRFGGTIVTFAAVGGSYQFVKLASANLREKEDPYNTLIGGLVGGSFLGLRGGTVPSVLGYGALVGITMATFDLCGGRLNGGFKQRGDEHGDEFDSKKYHRENRRRPVQENVDEMIAHNNWWAKRRAAKIKEAEAKGVPYTAYLIAWDGTKHPIDSPSK